MRTLIYGAGPIGRWLALRLHKAGKDVTLLARGETLRTLQRAGVTLVDGYSGARETARVKLVDRLSPRDDGYDLIVVAMSKAGRIAVCPLLRRCAAATTTILFLGNDVSGPDEYLRHLPREKVMLGFPRAGGGWDGDELVFVDRPKPRARRGPLVVGELDGGTRPRTRAVRALFEECGISVCVEKDMAGWLAYHFAFVGPIAGVVANHWGDLRSVAADPASLRQMVRACRQAGDVLARVGLSKRQPWVFNLFYWTPLWLAPKVFSKLFDSRFAEVSIGLHARAAGPEFEELTAGFLALRDRAGLETPDLDELLAPLHDLPSGARRVPARAETAEARG